MHTERLFSETIISRLNDLLIANTRRSIVVYLEVCNRVRISCLQGKVFKSILKCLPSCFDLLNIQTLKWNIAWHQAIVHPNYFRSLIEMHISLPISELVKFMQLTSKSCSLKRLVEQNPEMMPPLSLRFWDTSSSFESTFNYT